MQTNSLASSMRPKSLDDFIAQEHLLGKNAPLRQAIESKKAFHAFFFGPPGSGKTTLAHLIATKLEAPFISLNGVNFKLESLRKELSLYTLTQPVVFIDEIHRLSRTQQEFLLPIMENFEAIILGASTENPFYTLTQAIRSRSHIFELKPLEYEHLEKILDSAQKSCSISLDPEVKSYLIYSSNGDARAMLNLLDLALNTSAPITLEMLKSLRPTSLAQSCNEDNPHYNLASAMIKSIRGSDVDAAIYYLARLISGGENPDFIARRLAILASEDIGNANPNAINIASSTLNIVSKIGYPEARIPLAQCVIYLASSPKSNTAYNAINKALDYVAKNPDLPIPANILPNSKDYLYPHNFGGYVKQKYLAQKLEFVEKSSIGFEKNLNEWLEKITQDRQ